MSAASYSRNDPRLPLIDEIRKLRIASGISAEKLSRAIGFASSQWGAIESGHRIASVNILVAAARYFDRDVRMELTGEPVEDYARREIEKGATDTGEENATSIRLGAARSKYLRWRMYRDGFSTRGTTIRHLIDKEMERDPIK